MAKQVTPQEAVQRLARAVVIRSLRDFMFGSATPWITDIGAKLSAFEFLTSEEFRFWQDISGVEYDINVVFRDPERVKQTLRAEE